MNNIRVFSQPRAMANNSKLINHSINSEIKIDIIISRYQENIDWIEQIICFDFINKVHIYDKFYSNFEKSSIYKNNKIISYNLPNVGRESNTYLSFIINNYQNLPNQFYMFLQGDPFCHCTNIIDVIKDIRSYDLTNMFPFNSIVQENDSSPFRKCSTHPHGLNMAYFMKILFDMQLDDQQTIDVNYGAQFLVSQRIIKHRPINFYKYLYNMVSYTVNPIEGYVLERIWTYIFNEKINISNYYKQWLQTDKVIIALEQNNDFKNLIKNETNLWESIKKQIID